MTNIQIASQIINGLGSLINMVGVNFKKKSHVLIAFTLGNICVATALGLLGAFSGMIIQIIFVTETIINYFYEKKKGKEVKYPMWIIATYIIIPTIVLFIFYSSYWDFLPMLAGIFFPLALVSREFVLRLLNLLSVAVWIPYNFAFGQYVGTISCTIFTLVNLLAIIRLDVLRKTK